MSARLHLATADDLERLWPMVAAFHNSENVTQTDEQRLGALSPILAGSPHGAIWLIGPRKAPVGYVMISFGWSIELGGLDGFVDEFYIREGVRGRGMGTEVLLALLRDLSASGLKALHLEVDQTNTSAQKLYTKLGFRMRERYNLMSWTAPAG